MYYSFIVMKYMALNYGRLTPPSRPPYYGLVFIALLHLPPQYHWEVLHIYECASFKRCRVCVMLRINQDMMCLIKAPEFLIHPKLYFSHIFHILTSYAIILFYLFLLRICLLCVMVYDEKLLSYYYFISMYM